MSFEMYNAVVGQSGGPTAAINATLAGVIKACLDSDKIDKIYGMKNGIEGFLNENFFELNPYFEKTPAQLDLLSATPAAALGSCRKKLKTDEEIKNVFDILEKNNIRYFFYIGGNDSMDTIAMLSEYAEKTGNADVKFIGVPKTIDNDLDVTDHTPVTVLRQSLLQRQCRKYAVTVPFIPKRRLQLLKSWEEMQVGLLRHLHFQSILPVQAPTLFIFLRLSLMRKALSRM